MWSEVTSCKESEVAFGSSPPGLVSRADRRTEDFSESSKEGIM